jgi:hypothetical protein
MTKIRTTRLDAVIASVPLNSTAAKVMGRGTHWEPKLGDAPHMYHADHPPQMKAPKGNELDLRGQRFGRFLVVGLSTFSNQNKAAAWVVRCSCGKFECRKAKAIRNPANVDDCCRACRQLNYIKRTYSRLGSKPAADFFAKPKS